MENCVGNRGRHTRNADFADSPRTHGRVFIGNNVEENFNVRYVQIHWNVRNVDHLLERSLADRFSAVYKNRVWLNGRQAGALSGLGSEVANTGVIRDQLPQMLKSLGTRTLLDIGCGDFNWMKEIRLPCAYIGVDIVRDLIKVDAIRYGGNEGDSRLLMQRVNRCRRQTRSYAERFFFIFRSKTFGV